MHELSINGPATGNILAPSFMLFHGYLASVWLESVMFLPRCLCELSSLLSRGRSNFVFQEETILWVPRPSEERRGYVELCCRRNPRPRSTEPRNTHLNQVHSNAVQWSVMGIKRLTTTLRRSLAPPAAPVPCICPAVGHNRLINKN